jgi:hypothetical protein
MIGDFQIRLNAVQADGILFADISRQLGRKPGQELFGCAEPSLIAAAQRDQGTPWRNRRRKNE